jgi:hypothetical protein
VSGWTVPETGLLSQKSRLPNSRGLGLCGLMLEPVRRAPESCQVCIDSRREHDGFQATLDCCQLPAFYFTKHATLG